MRVVLDTNVLVSGLLRPSSVPARVLYLIHESRVRPVVDGRLLGEYAEVLARPRLGISADIAAELLRHLSDVSEHVTVIAEDVSRLDRVALPDAGDRPLIELAVSAGVSAIVTGNTRHFPTDALEPVRVLTPRQLLEELGVEA